jgi:hypothetical protein
MRWAGHAARMGQKRNAYRILVGKPEGKSPLGISIISASLQKEQNVFFLNRSIA